MATFALSLQLRLWPHYVKSNTNTEDRGHTCELTIPLYERWKTVHVSGRAFSVTGIPLLCVKQSLPQI
jgi:hypothetical protein